MILLAGCGGGGSGSAAGEAPGVSPAGPVTLLTWDPPATFADNEPVDPYRDIDHYEVYVREDAEFHQFRSSGDRHPRNDQRRSHPCAVHRRIKKEEFPLGNPESVHFLKASRQYVSLKAVGVDGQKSAFMPPVAWDRT